MAHLALVPVHVFPVGACAAALLALGGCGGGGSHASADAASASASAASAGTTTTTTTTTTTVVVVTTTAASSPSTAASSPGKTASSPSTTASSPSTTASSPAATASSPAATASAPATTASAPATAASTPTAAANAASGALGLWNGTTSTGRTLFGLVLGDGNYYLFYTGVNAAPTSYIGVLIGHGSAATGTFMAPTDAWDYSLEGNGASTATMPSTNFAAKQSLTGSLHYAAADVNFSATYDSRFDSAPSLADLAGAYSGGGALTIGGGAVTLTIDATGALSGSFAGTTCDITGKATARTDGNAYDMKLVFGAATCPLTGQTLNGAAFYNSANRQLLLSAPTANRHDGFLVIANKP